jgi:nitrite reductase/ring-hydroxylating ferredoxin subunit
MLSKEDNELITNTDPGTPMGELFRRFWLPVALSEELPGPDCAPLRLEILGEHHIAFRDSEGRVGLVDPYCPHRGAPLFFGRNEESGLRCVYHGWKFDVAGNCVDLPNAPEGETFKHKIRARAYPCVDRGDLIWAYMGPADKQPPFPKFPWLDLPKSHRYVSKFRLECNWLQALEGDGDPSHARFLHSMLQDAQIANPLTSTGRRENAVETPYAGLKPPEEEPFPMAVGYRRIKADDIRSNDRVRLEDSDAAYITVQVDAQDDGQYRASVGVSGWLPMFSTAGLSGPNVSSSNMRIPIDNKSLMFFRLRWSWDPIPQKDIEEYKHGGYFYPPLIPGTWKTRDNVSNDYNINRVAQKYFSYTGISSFPLQDICVIENQWGPLADRTREHLTSMDYITIYRRRRLLRLAKALAAGVEPEEPWNADAFAYHGASATAATAEDAIAQAKARSKDPTLRATRRRAEPVAQEVAT